MRINECMYDYVNMCKQGRGMESKRMVYYAMRYIISSYWPRKGYVFEFVCITEISTVYPRIDIFIELKRFVKSFFFCRIYEAGILIVVVRWQK